MAAEPPAPPPLGPWQDDSSGYDPWAYGSWGYQPWMEPPPPPPRRTFARGLVALLLIVVLVTGATAGVIVLITRQGALSSLGGSSGATSSAVAQIDQAVVDVTSRLAGGQGIAAGTGLGITARGEVRTNNHVIAGADTITAQIDGAGPVYTASVVGDDPVNDVALLQLQGVSGLPTVSVGDSSSLSVGQQVTAIGNALGQGGPPTVSQGTVTAVNQTITVSGDQGQAETLTGLIEMDAPIQQGDSGGPLVDSSGKVVGMDTAAEVGGGFRRHGPSAAGYAIPLNNAMTVVRQIRQGGGGSSTVQTGSPPILGVEVSTSANGGSGVGVAGVEPGSPAVQAGIAAGDLITALGGKGVSSPGTLRTAIRTHRAGDRVTVAWVDARGQQHSADVQLISGPPA